MKNGHERDPRSAETEALRDEIFQLHQKFDLLCTALSEEGMLDARFLEGNGKLFDRMEALEKLFDHPALASPPSKAA